LVDVGAHRAGDVGELEEDFTSQVRWLLHAVIISMLMNMAVVVLPQRSYARPPDLRKPFPPR